MRTEIEITQIERRGDVVKTPGDSRGAWALPITYVLADGRRVDATDRFRLKRDAAAFAATLPRAPEHPMAASFEDGRFWGTRTTYSWGA